MVLRDFQSMENLFFILWAVLLSQVSLSNFILFYHYFILYYIFFNSFLPIFDYLFFF